MKYFTKTFFGMGYIIVSLACNQTSTRSPVRTVDTTLGLKAQLPAYFNVEVFKNENGTYGYDIMEHNKILIHQVSMPGKSDSTGFATSEEARSVASVIVMKLRQDKQAGSNKKDSTMLNY
ncbi:hypothetical protein COR50_01130 [Chitinophaga caeni]|uniref:DUF4907 domain-containing protein n=1 Tax=Chitinophaga caeni TaxID=2029983 RepID=A0A291QPU6_9BACT|nr:DUF4907 domain-containing protein [Chitinophaga caeni]ATL45874.1 hypothetical protein COR50_01130 [Chitinophaga caeni]